MDETTRELPCECALTPCDTSTDSPHQVAFAPQAAKASNCRYFAVSTPRFHSAGAAILLLKNPAASNTILYVTIESVSNYGAEAVAAYLATDIALGGAKCCDAEIFQTNLGCSASSAAQACRASLAYTFPLRDAEFLTQDIVAPLSTLRIDHQGGFVVTPGKSLAIVAAGLCLSDDKSAGCVNVGLDLRWWETPCNSHT